MTPHIPAHGIFALDKSEWFVQVFFFFFFFIAVVVMYWEARLCIHQQKHITLFVLRVIYSKPYYWCVVRLKLNRGPSACRTVCGEPNSSIFSVNCPTPSKYNVNVMLTDLLPYWWTWLGFCINLMRLWPGLFSFFIRSRSAPPLLLRSVFCTVF